MKGERIFVQGIVQGVGFRPFVKRLADSMNISGYVINTSSGVEIFIAVSGGKADDFVERLLKDAPPLSHIVSLKREAASEDDCGFFVIKPSSVGSGITMASPDAAICPECRKEIETAGERRYGYAFTNCTNCGPRYSITEKLPYDRPNTVMKSFKMCPDCEREYNNRSDRRFHAQPIACPVCGPNIYLNYKGEIITEPERALAIAAEEVNSGGIIAVKGLGGYHLICDACNSSAINKLRTLKNRREKPLAVMCKDIAVLKKYIDPGEDYCRLIDSAEAPIVIIKWKNHPLSEFINPLSDKIGIMIAYTPLHVLLLNRLNTDFIVATSGNLRDEPIAKDPDEAEKNLHPFTDVFLHHSRPIKTRLDDSVLAATANGYTILRRARGFAPFPVVIKSDIKAQVFAAGANLKSGMAFYKDGFAFLSQYIGDLDTAGATELYGEVFYGMKELFNISPEIAVSDIHADYRSSDFADKLGLSRIKVQHHAAHFASCLAENSFYGDAVGVVLDGFGIGSDGEAWGGEFFVKKGSSVYRHAGLKKFVQPGMDAAAKHPGRMLISYLLKSNLLERCRAMLKLRLGMEKGEVDLVATICEKQINSILTTSAGRLFEAVGSLLAGKKTNEYEGALAIALESMADDCEKGAYSFGSGCEIDPSDAFYEIISDLEKGVPESVISARFHNGFAACTAEIAMQMASKNGIGTVALSGGVFQNIRLLNSVVNILENAQITVLTHKKVPSNDGGIALGQLYFFLQELNLFD